MSCFTRSGNDQESDCTDTPNTVHTIPHRSTAVSVVRNMLTEFSPSRA